MPTAKFPFFSLGLLYFTTLLPSLDCWSFYSVFTIITITSFWYNATYQQSLEDLFEKITVHNKVKIASYSEQIVTFESTYKSWQSIECYID